MKSKFTRLLGQPPISLSDSWTENESFVVQRTPTGVDYGRVMGGLKGSTSVVEPPGNNRASSMASPTRQLPCMPEIGRPESYYATQVRSADGRSDVHTREAAKVGQYITLGLDPALAWEDKLKFFRHALKRHCVPPPYPDDEVWMFYQQLAELVRSHCGHEALRLACAEDDLFAARLGMGQTRDRIEEDAEDFFRRLMVAGDQCPEWFNDTDWLQLKLIRDQWI